MPKPISIDEHPKPHTASNRRWQIFFFVLGAALLGWIFSGYFSPQIMIDFVLRYCA